MSFFRGHREVVITRGISIFCVEKYRQGVQRGNYVRGSWGCQMFYPLAVRPARPPLEAVFLARLGNDLLLRASEEFSFFDDCPYG